MAYRLSDVVNNYRAVGVPVVHGCQRLISFLPRSVPYFKFYRCGVIEGDGLGKEGGTDCRFSVVVELIFDESEDEGALSARQSDLPLQRVSSSYEPFRLRIHLERC